MGVKTEPVERHYFHFSLFVCWVSLLEEQNFVISTPYLMSFDWSRIQRK